MAYIDELQYLIWSEKCVGYFNKPFIVYERLSDSFIPVKLM